MTLCVRPAGIFQPPVHRCPEVSCGQCRPGRAAPPIAGPESCVFGCPPRSRHCHLDLVPFLIEYPVVTVKHAQSLLGVSNPSANGAVNTLESMGILVETTGGNYNRVFEVPAVLDVIFGQQATNCACEQIDRKLAKSWPRPTVMQLSTSRR